MREERPSAFNERLEFPFHFCKIHPEARNTLYYSKTTVTMQISLFQCDSTSYLLGFTLVHFARKKKPMNLDFCNL